jgi:hypothetical protein
MTRMAPRRSAWVTSHRRLCPLRPSKRIRKRQRKRKRVRNDSDKRIPIERFDRGNLRPCPFNANARACESVQAVAGTLESRHTHPFQTARNQTNCVSKGEVEM